MLLEDAGISTPLTITPGQSVSVTGDRSLAQAPLWGSGGFIVQERGLLSLTYVGLGTSTITTDSGGALTLISMVVPVALSITNGILTVKQSTLSSTLTVSEGSTASLSGCTLSDTLSITEGSAASLSDCSGQLTNLAVDDATFAMDAPSTVAIGGPLSLSNAGAVNLEGKTFLDGASLAVSGATELSLVNCALDVSLSLTLGSDSSLSLSSMTVPAGVLSAAQAQLSGPSSTLRLSAVSVPEMPGTSAMAGTMTVGVDDNQPSKLGRSRSTSLHHTLRAELRVRQLLRTRTVHGHRWREVRRPPGRLLGAGGVHDRSRCWWGARGLWRVRYQ